MVLCEAFGLKLMRNAKTNVGLELERLKAVAERRILDKIDLIGIAE